jgi:hypothetical protein
VDEQHGIELVEDVRAAPPGPALQETTTDGPQLFLRDAGRRPLLTAAQEVELTKRVERGDVDARHIALARLSNSDSAVEAVVSNWPEARFGAMSPGALLR